MSFPDNENNFVESESTTAPRRVRPARTVRSRTRGASRRVSTPAGDKWKTTTIKAATTRQPKRFFLRENPVPTIVGMLVVGVAIGLAVHYASTRRDDDDKSPLGNLDWSFLSFPFLWPFFRSVQKKYDDSAAAVRTGVERLKKIDIEDYTDPIRKRWSAWRH
jgi:hypothetical protein